MSEPVPKHPVIQLRDIQLLLKREELLLNYRREAAANSMEALTMRHAQLLGERKMLLLYNQQETGDSTDSKKCHVVKQEQVRMSVFKERVHPVSLRLALLVESGI